MQSINAVCFSLIQGGVLCTCFTRNNGLLYERFFSSGGCASWCCADKHGVNYKFDRGCVFPASFDTCSNSKYFQSTQIIVVPSIMRVLE